MRHMRTRIMALVLAMAMSLSCAIPAFAAEEHDVVLEQVFGTSDATEITAQALEELAGEEAAVTIVNEDEGEPTDPEVEPGDGSETEPTDPVDPPVDPVDPPVEPPVDPEEPEEPAQLKAIRWELEDGTYAEEASYVYTGEAIQPAYQVEDAEETYNENWYCDEELTQPTDDFTNCGTLYLVLTDEEGEAVAAGSYAITQAEQTITGLKSSYTLAYHEELTLAGKAKGKLTYTSSNAKIAKITDNKTIRLESVGNATITVKAAETRNYKAAQKTFKIVGTKAEQIIVVGADGKADGVMSKKFAKNDTIDLRVKVEGNGKVTYQCDNTAIATVSKAGIVTMKKGGTVVITITAAETAEYNAAEYVVETHLYITPKSIGYSSSYKSGKYYKALMALKLSGTARQNILAIAQSQIGYHESNSSKKLSGTVNGSNNYNEFGRFYGMNGVAWCAIFVNWCARQNGVSTNVIPKYCAVREYYAFYHRKGQHYYDWNKVRQKKYQPKPGDIILYSNSKGATTHHIGYVISTKYTSDYVTITTVEGNTSDAVRKVTMKMKRSSSSGKVNGHYITGFASPNY